MNAYYTVDGVPFYNVYLAWYRSVEIGKPVKFYLNDDVYDRYDWTKEPEQSFDELMLSHALRLRDQNQKLIFFYSGGYDSHTIYDVFARNRIHIDAIVTSASVETPFFPVKTYKWLLENHWDPATEITMLDVRDSSNNNFFDSDDWIFRNEGLLLRYYGGLINSVESWCYEKFGAYTWRCIMGLEKPRLIYKNGQWHSRQLAAVIDQSLGRVNVERFFLEPSIAIKQSHLLKRNVNAWVRSKNIPVYENDWAETKFGNDQQGMYHWNVSCGRIPELNPGSSWLQKKFSETVAGVEHLNHNGAWTNIDTVSPTSKFVIEDLRKGQTQAKNFLKAVYEINSQSKLVNYFKHNNLFRSQRQSMLYDLPFVWSKEYQLGP